MKIEDIDILDEKVKAARNITHDIEALINMKGWLSKPNFIFASFPFMKETEMPSVESGFYRATDAILKEALLPIIDEILKQKEKELTDL